MLEAMRRQTEAQYRAMIRCRLERDFALASDDPVGAYLALLGRDYRARQQRTQHARRAAKQGRKKP
jgi:hypothetical protein